MEISCGGWEIKEHVLACPWCHVWGFLLPFTWQIEGEIEKMCLL